MTPEETKLHKYYYNKFGWTLAEVDLLFTAQGHVCAICKRPPGKYRLSLDHAHSFDKIKINIYRDCDDYYWVADAIPQVEPFGGYSTRKDAKDAIRRKLRRRSVRGGLCLRCNKGIQMFEDSKAPLAPAERFDRAATYFRDFSTKLSGN